MTLEEMFCDLYDKYSKDFNWYMIPFTQADGAFAAELKKEIGQDHFLYGKKILAVAKCESNDDVLYVLRNRIGRNIYYLVHLTYSAQNADGFPRYEEFADIFAVKEFIEIFCENWQNPVKQRITPHFLTTSPSNYYEFTTKE